jgi:rhodanese-related sulfurtransferase
MHTIDEVKSLLDSGYRLIFIDARSEEAWAKSDKQIPGSIRIAPDRADELAAAIPKAAIPKGATIVTYCTCPQERSSTRVARALLDRGWKDVHPMFGGFNKWVSRFYPTAPKQEAQQVA